MIRKLLFILLILTSVFIYSQSKEVGDLKDLSTYPNPFSHETEISFDSTKKQSVILTVTNLLGRNVIYKEIDAEKGTNKILIERDDLNAGAYIYAIRTRKEILSKRFLIE